MGRNEIRLRRQMMSAGRIARHRNYGDLLARHERDVKLKHLVKLVTYFLAAAFLVVLMVILSRWEKREEKKDDPKPEPTSIVVRVDAHNYL